jgi:hypothetical protein
VTDAAAEGTGDEGRLAILTNTGFQSGTIEVEVAVAAAPGAAGVRVWHLMSRGRGPRGGDRCRRSFVLPILSRFDTLRRLADDRDQPPQPVNAGQFRRNHVQKH